MTLFYYGMRCRPFSIGCQPMDNFIEVKDDPENKFYNILVYSAPLNPEDVKHYSLTDLQAKTDLKSLLIDLYKSLNRDLIKDLDTYARKESKKPLINLIKAYCDKTIQDPQPDFIEYLTDLKNNNSISCQNDYYEIIDFMTQETN